MVYRIDNRKKKHHGRYTALGIVFGIILALGGVYVYENYKKPIMENVNDIIVENAPKPEPSQTIQVPTIIPERQLSAEEIAQQIHILINQQRESNGLISLSWDSNLSNIAKSHSNDMIKNNYFDHRGLPQRLQEMGCSTGSENLAWIQQFKINEISQRMVNNWMASDIHRSNILNPSFNSEGIGVTINGNYVVATDDFC